MIKAMQRVEVSQVLNLFGVKEVKGVRGVKAVCYAGVKTPLHRRQSIGFNSSNSFNF